MYTYILVYFMFVVKIIYFYSLVNLLINFLIDRWIN